LASRFYNSLYYRTSRDIYIYNKKKTKKKTVSKCSVITYYTFSKIQWLQTHYYYHHHYFILYRSLLNYINQFQGPAFFDPAFFLSCVFLCGILADPCWQKVTNCRYCTSKQFSGAVNRSLCRGIIACVPPARVDRCVSMLLVASINQVAAQLTPRPQNLITLPD